jgi:tripartite motif-containing protein 71
MHHLSLTRISHRFCAALAAALWLVLAFGGCSRSARLHLRSHPRSSRRVLIVGKACPGADPCPYTSIALIGRSGEGVLRFPEAVAVAANGEVYVADQYSYLVQRFSSNGRFLGQWGSHGAGLGQFGSVGGLAVTPAGDVYLIDSEHDRVEEFEPSGRFVRAWGAAGRALGQFDFGSGGPGVPPGGGIAVAHGYVYVADTGNDRVERFTLQGTEPEEWGEGGHGPGQFDSPRGLAVHGEDVYVADDGNDRIEELTTAGSYVRQVGAFGSGTGQFADPFGVAVGPSGEVYVADDNNHRVDVLSADLRYQTAWALAPVQGESGGLHPNSGGEQVGYPRAIATSAGGLVYVADAASNQIYEFGPTGGLLAAWGTSGRSYGQFILPEDVVGTPSGGALVADMLGGRVELFAAAAAAAHDGGGADGGGQLAYGSSSSGGAKIVGDHLFKPVALALADDGSMWVTDQENGLVRHLGSEGELLGTLGNGGPLGVAGMPGATGTGGAAYVPSAQAASRGLAATAHGSSSTAGARVRAAQALAGRLFNPAGVAIGAHGEIYVADTGEDLIKRYSPTGVPLGAWGGPGSTPGHFHGPVALAVDAASGDVYVADTGNDRIQKFTAAGHYLGEWGAPGGAAGELRGPDGIAVDAGEGVFVADGGNDRIEEFDSHGRFLRMWGAPGAAPGELSEPAGLSIGCGGSLLVADTDNNRVVRFGGVAPPGHCTTAAAP